ncbi:MAG: FHA domain-containing protein [Nannocystaceae bacterium]|nr:FHA domain-containing protein [Nannocystaceae bacterium]
MPLWARFCGECGRRVEATTAYGMLPRGEIERAWLDMIDAAGRPAASVESVARMPEATAADIMWQLMSNEDITAVWSSPSAMVDDVTRVDVPAFAHDDTQVRASASDEDDGDDDEHDAHDDGPAHEATAIAYADGGDDTDAPGYTLALPPARAALLIRLAPTGFPGQGVPVDAEVVPRGGTRDVGREFDGPWRDDPYLDEWHARLVSDPEGVRLIDPGSRGGVWLRLDGPCWLRDGDHFRVGEQFLCFDASPGVTDPRGARPEIRGRVQLLDDELRFGLAVPVGVPAVIGRGGSDIALLHDPFVSGQHARLVPEGDGVRLEDLGSSNGTWLRLRSGDLMPFGAIVAIGRQLFRVAQAEP